MLTFWRARETSVQGTLSLETGVCADLGGGKWGGPVVLEGLAGRRGTRPGRNRVPLWCFWLGRDAVMRVLPVDETYVLYWGPLRAAVNCGCSIWTLSSDFIYLSVEL